MLKKKFPVDTYWENFLFHFDDDSFSVDARSTGLSIYEEDDKIIIEAALPGVKADDVELSHAHGFLLIEGEKKEKEKGRKYYTQANRSFSYRIPIPAKADVSQEPEAVFKDGVMKVSFQKGKKIPVKEEE